MKVLFDTHAFIWNFTNDKKLSEKVKKLSFEAEPYLSAASIWELSIKKSKGKLNTHLNIEQLIQDAKNFGMRELPIHFSHALEVQSLPPVHGDPFDRMLAAQSIMENMPIISSDSIFDEYKVKRIWD